MLCYDLEKKKRKEREREGKRKETITTWLSLSLAQVPRKAECGPGLEEEILCSQRGKLLESLSLSGRLRNGGDTFVFFFQ